ncbi:DUF6892 domain-containing protein [Flintibacter muris]|uniref:DUF6892 domain-containing protein n=1 Tax=Flintibacter muris TaxID=2941327 RepID=UPI00204213DA|nr:hypothetical protein [Flintibacter muris]
MGLLDRFKRNTAPAEEFLVFDNLPFKLAVVQKLMYDEALLGEKYRGGDEYFERYDDIEEASEQESLARLKPYIQRGNRFFQALQVPVSLAGKITELYVGEELEIYFQINPQWLDFDEFFQDGAAFDILDISERELKQFPNLTSITFGMYHTPPAELVKKLEGFGIQVTAED